MRNGEVWVHVVRDFQNPMVTEAADAERGVPPFDDELLLLDLGLASQESHIGRYHMGIYASPDLMEWFVQVYP